jgi:hypothetical protein
MKKLDVKVTFFKPEDGGRERTPERLLESKQYRPHLLVYATEKIRSKHHMGVCFISQQNDLVAGFECEAKVVLMYDGVDYSRLVQGANFTIVEGQRIVGNGFVL